MTNFLVIFISMWMSNATPYSNACYYSGSNVVASTADVWTLKMQVVCPSNLVAQIETSYQVQGAVKSVSASQGMEYTPIIAPTTFLTGTNDITIPFWADPDHPAFFFRGMAIPGATPLIMTSSLSITADASIPIEP